MFGTTTVPYERYLRLSLLAFLRVFSPLLDRARQLARPKMYNYLFYFIVARAFFIFSSQAFLLLGRPVVFNYAREYHARERDGLNIPIPH